MIEIRYDEARLTMEIRGHADYDISGKDIVCAAISVLEQTLIQNLINRERPEWYVLDWEDETDGVYIHAKPITRAEDVREMFRFTMTGMRMIEEQYPDYIRIEEGEGNGNV